MAYYKDSVTSIGSSDIATLIFVGYDMTEYKVKAEAIRYGGDGSYKAYLVNDKALIPSHYRKVAEFRTFLNVYDDSGIAFKASYHPRFEVYRAGDYGTIIYEEERDA